jgi:hypothetical protein
MRRYYLRVNRVRGKTLDRPVDAGFKRSSIRDAAQGFSRGNRSALRQRPRASRPALNATRPKQLRLPKPRRYLATKEAQTSSMGPS